jgi:uroporphyrinogen decarboxylase
MHKDKSDFLKALSKELLTNVPIYCTGYPELKFIEKYMDLYSIKTDNIDSTLYNKNYNIIEQMGFDAISLWDFRRGEGGYDLGNNMRVDGWGRIYKGDWYIWDGVFKNKKTIENWEHLKLPSKEHMLNLKNYLNNPKINLEYAISLPGLFEKTWQSMSFHFFAKCLNQKNFEFVKQVISFFSNYLKRLIELLQTTGAKIFLIADDIGYKNRTFISRELWRKLFFKEYKEIINIIHRRKQYIIIHSDGYISDMIGTFIELGFDAVQSLEPSAGVNIFNLFKELGSQICFIGNLDMGLLSFGTPQEVKDYTLKLIIKSKDNNCPLVVSPSQQINVKCKPQNINAIIETTKIFKY